MPTTPAQIALALAVAAFGILAAEAGAVSAVAVCGAALLVVGLFDAICSLDRAFWRLLTADR